jgi:hypothetical protein
LLQQITDRGRQLFAEDSVRKQLLVYVYDSTENINGNLETILNDENIISESMKFSEGILDNDKLEFGSYFSKQISFERIYDNVSYKNKRCVCILQVYDNDGTVTDHIVLLVGRIYSDKISDDGFKSTVTAYDSLYYVQNIDLNQKGYIRREKKSAWEHIFDTLSDYELNIVPDVFLHGQSLGALDENVAKVFPNATEEIDFTNLPDEKYLVKDFLKDSGEFLGAVIQAPTTYRVKSVFDGDGMSTWDFTIAIDYKRIDTLYETVFPNDKIYPSNTIYPGFISLPYTYELPYYIDFHYEGEDIIPYNAITIYKENSVIGSADSQNENKVEYVINDNKFFTFCPRTADILKDHLEQIAVEYALTTIDIPYLPFLQSSDNLFVHTGTAKGAVLIPILKIEVNGINSMRAKIECLANTI